MDAALIVALIVGLSASTFTPLILGYLNSQTRRREREEDKTEREAVRVAAEDATHIVQGKLEEVHTIVNSQRTEMRQYIEMLSQMIRESGAVVPPDPSLE